MKMNVNTDSQLEAIGEFQQGQTDRCRYDDESDAPSRWAQNRPSQRQQPAQEERDDEQQDAAQPGQRARLDQSEEQREGHQDDDEPARDPLQNQ